MPGQDRGWDDEAARVARRRRALDLPAPAAHDRLALALSGKGVRGATFCLGVMQALAEAPFPTASTPTIPPAADDTSGTRSLLAHVDYLSTVGSGGYIGAFFTSLFVPGRLRADSSPEQAATEAYRTLRDDPADRAAIASLRENTRHLTSRSTADGLRAAAVVVRNWIAMQCVIGSALLTVLAVLALALHLIIGAWPGVGRNEMALLYEARRAFHEDLLPIWWSEYLWLPIVSSLLLAVPPGMAYWLVHPRTDAPRQPAHSAVRAILLAIVAGALVLLETLATAVLIWLAVATCLVILLPAPRTVAVYRVRARRALRAAFSLTAALIALGVADTVARTCYLYGSMTAQPWSVAAPAAVAIVLAWLVHHVATRLDTSGAGSPGRLTSPLPASFLTGAAAAVLVLLLFISWSWIVLWVRWDGGEPVDWLVFGKAWTTPSLAMLVFAALAMSLAVGRLSSLLNRSTLQPLHAARLTRAYLGASNGQRLHTPAGNPHDMHRPGVTTPAPGDALSLDAYFDPHVLAPLHLINVTMNQTIDPSAHLARRGRRGKPLCIGPGSALSWPSDAGPTSAEAYVRFMADGKPCHAPSQLPGGASVRAKEPAQARTIADWLAISGAAVRAGPGNAATLGASLLVGLANLRPGIWWPSGTIGDCAHGGWLGRLFRTQYCLACELTGRFHGVRGGWQYLSDGGHFDNTAVYELLRPERHVGLIVLCDGGDDSGYHFDGLANLIRLAREDLGLEIVVDQSAAHDPILGDVFGTPSDFAEAAPVQSRNKAALLLNVHTATRTGVANGPPVARIVLLKPRLTASASAQVLRHAAQHPAFPQENTTDAGFGDAEWESYRALGVTLGRRIAAGAVAVRLFAPAP